MILNVRTLLLGFWMLLRLWGRDIEHVKAVQLDYKLCLKQTKLIAEATAEGTTQWLFDAPQNDFGVTSGVEPQSTGPQDKFRHNLLCVSDVQYPGAVCPDLIWHPVTRTICPTLQPGRSLHTIMG